LVCPGTLNLQTNKNHILRETTAIGGHKWIYEDLLRRLADADIATSAQHLGLAINDAEEVNVPFLGATYLISKRGARRTDGKGPSYATGSALIHYILKGSRSRPNGQIVTLSELAGPLFKQGSFSQSALEQPIIKQYQGRVIELFSKAAVLGGYQGGEAGLGGVSLMFDLLLHIPLLLFTTLF
jgi:hypothetical protein